MSAVLKTRFRESIHHRDVEEMRNILLIQPNLINERGLVIHTSFSSFLLSFLSLSLFSNLFYLLFRWVELL